MTSCYPQNVNLYENAGHQSAINTIHAIFCDNISKILLTYKVKKLIVPHE